MRQAILAITVAVAAIALISQDAAAASLCQASPQAECRDAGKTTLRLAMHRNPDKRRISARLTMTDPSSMDDFGNPSNSTTYAICVWDHIASTPVLVQEALINPTSDWSTNIRTPGWRYDDFLGAEDGVVFGRLRPSNKAGRAKVSFRALGEDVPVVAPFSNDLLLALDQKVVLQVLNSDGNCWQAEFLNADVNRKRAFKAQGY